MNLSRLAAVWRQYLARVRDGIRPLTGVCVECGTTVEPGERFCSTEHAARNMADAAW